MQMLTEQGKPLPLKPLEECQYLLDAFLECGVSDVSSGMGETPLTWREVWAYAQATRAISEPWEFRALIDMSRAFVRARKAGEDPFEELPIGA
jgi:hypothetical protein